LEVVYYVLYHIGAVVHERVLHLPWYQEEEKGLGNLLALHHIIVQGIKAGQKPE
jgi:hypothetical protein